MQTLAPISQTAIECARRQLQQLGESSPGIQLAVLTSPDGYEIACYRAHGADSVAARIAAMTSSITALADAFSRETGLSDAHNLVIESAAGTVVLLTLRQTRQQLSLAIVASKQAILGHLLWAARNAGNAIARIAE